MSTTTWADGFGIWHVRVSKACASPLIAARKVLREELTARYNGVSEACWKGCERVPSLDTEDTYVYREGGVTD